MKKNLPYYSKEYEFYSTVLFILSFFLSSLFFDEMMNDTINIIFEIVLIVYLWYIDVLFLIYVTQAIVWTQIWLK